MHRANFCKSLARILDLPQTLEKGRYLPWGSRQGVGRFNRIAVGQGMVDVMKKELGNGEGLGLGLMG